MRNIWKCYLMQTNAIMIILISYFMDFLKGIPLYIMNTWVNISNPMLIKNIDLKLKKHSSFTVQIHLTDKI